MRLLAWLWPLSNNETLFGNLRCISTTTNNNNYLSSSLYSPLERSPLLLSRWWLFLPFLPPLFPRRCGNEDGVGAPSLTPMSDRVTVRGGIAPGERIDRASIRAPHGPLRCVWICNLLLRQRVRWDYPPVNSGPLAQGSVRYGLAHLDSVTVGFRRSQGPRWWPPGARRGQPGRRGKFSGVNTRRIAFTVMLMMSVVAAALAGMLYAGRLESGGGTSGAPATSSRSLPRSSSSAPASAWAA